MFCTNCGIELPSDVRFCENCGTKVQNIESKELHYNYVWKKCGTCVHWTGPRSIDNFRTTVTIAGPEVKGMCVDGGFNRTMMQAGSSCSSYEKWPLLKI